VQRVRVLRIAGAVVAAALVAASAMLPLWTMTMKAPQYPKGLRLNAYGTGISGDLREIDILNHYLGMPPLETPQVETALFLYGIALLIGLCLLAPLHRYLWRTALGAVAITPLVVLGDLQWRLYTFGHSFDPHAPIRLKAFTPPVIGTNTMWNFETSAMISAGLVCLLAAAAVLAIIGRLTRGPDARRYAPAEVRPAIAAMLAWLLVGLPAPAHADATALQARLSGAAPGSTVVVDGGVHQGPVVVRGPLTVIGLHGPIVDGNGTGSVVTIAGTGVVFRGFTVRNSGREVTEEAAGITVTGDRHRIEANDIHDVYFGIHVEGGTGHVIEGNRIAPGELHGARPGHGISVWYSSGSRLAGNRISDARDGIYLSFTDGVVASDNEVARCRYGMHSMYSQNATFAGNRLTANLLGAALMMSNRLTLRGNRIEQHRQGTAAYGILLKDIGDLHAEDNVITANRIGLYAEGVPSQPAREAVLARNVIAGNEVGLALQSNAALTLTGNRIADNLTDVRALGRQLAPAMRWSRDGRGNSWSQYRGYDADRDGIGDVPHRVEDTMDALVRRNPMAQAFLYTPAHLALEAAARMFPLMRQAPLLVDEHPVMSARNRGSR
jgi:nitrous oxidase accessory protein